MATPAKKPRVYKESVKVRHTTHWDIDYLPLKEVDDLYGRGSGALPVEAPKRAWFDKEKLTRHFRRLPPWLVLFIVVLLFGRFVIALLFHLLS